MKSLTILIILLLSVTATASSEIVSSEVMWSEYPILRYIGIGDYIETITYSDGYQENTYHRGFVLSPASITSAPESITYTIGQPELKISVQLKGQSCSLSNTPYSYHHLGLYNTNNNNFLLYGKTAGGIICGATVSYDFIIPKSDLGLIATTPGTYLLNLKETSWNTLDIGGRILYENREFELVVNPSSGLVQFEATNIVPSKFVITTTEAITISSNIKNTGTVTATLPVELKINDVKYDSQSVTLNSGESKTITFNNVKFPIAGNHRISILGQSNTIVVSGVSQTPVPTPTPAPPAGQGTISVTSNPTGATVRIQSIEVGNTPVSTQRPPGNYIIATSMIGYKTDYYGVTVTSGQTVSHFITLSPIVTTTPTPTPTPTQGQTSQVTPSITIGTTPGTTPATSPGIDTEVECPSGYIWDNMYETCRPISETVVPSGDTTIYLIIGAILIIGLFLVTRKK